VRSTLPQTSQILSDQPQATAESDGKAAMKKRSRLIGWQVTRGPLWLTIEGQKT
jgi:hypothetical protein